MNIKMAEIMNDDKIMFYWTEPELLDKKTWQITKVMLGSGNVMKKMTFKSKQDAWAELKRISINIKKAPVSQPSKKNNKGF